MTLVGWVPKALYDEHLNNFPLLTVDAALFTEDYKGILLVKRNSNNTLWTDDWATVGGRVFKGETLKHAIARKVREEVGISLPESAFTEKGTAEIIYDVGHWVTVVFSAIITGREEVKLDNTSTYSSIWPVDILQHAAPPIRPKVLEFIAVGLRQRAEL